MASKCYVCGEPAVGDCLVCGKVFCSAHGDRLCAQCGEQDEVERRAEAYEGLPSPLFFRGALAIAILAVLLEIGWDSYKSLTGSPAQGYVAPTAIAVAQTPPAQPTVQAVSQPTPQPPPVASPTAAPPSPTPAVTRHTVQAGETLETIAARYGTTWQAIQAANNYVDPSRLQIGQVLVIPPKQ